MGAEQSNLRPPTTNEGHNDPPQNGGEALIKTSDKTNGGMSDPRSGNMGRAMEKDAEKDVYITLRLGERWFTALKQTLTNESGYFKARFGGRCNERPSADGSYPVDADPDLFVHILQYLRRGIYPLIYSRAGGHDYAAYLALLAEAKYFQIDSLRKWIEQERYVDAVSTAYEVERQVIDTCYYDSTDSNSQLSYQAAWGTKKVYICPRGIAVHRGDRNKCGKLCAEARGMGDIYEDEAVMSAIVIRQRTRFNMKICWKHQITAGSATADMYE